MYSKRDVLRRRVGAYVEYSAIARFRENFHSLREFPFLEEGGISSCRKVSRIHYGALCSVVCFVLKLDSGPFNFTLPSSGLKLIAHLVFAFYRDSRVRSTKNGRHSDIPEEKKARSETSFGACTRFVSWDSTKNGLPIIGFTRTRQRFSCSNIPDRQRICPFDSFMIRL